MKANRANHAARTIAAVLGVVLASLSPAAHAAAGDLDRGFGVGGVQTLPFRDAYAYADEVARQADGKIVVLGTAHSSVGILSDFALVRLLSDGSLDTTFGDEGRVTTDFDGRYDEGLALALQPDGKIVVAGNDSGRGLLLARYTSNGALDQGFGSGGSVLTRLEGPSEATAVAIQPDGKIVAAGRTRDGAVYTYAVARYDAAGSLDPSFGRGGVVVTRLAPLPKVVSGTAVGAVLQADGKIVVGGTLQQLTGGASPTFGLARYLVTPGCRVPDIRGRLLARARATLVSAGCSVGAITHARSKKVKRGRVISEHPAPGTGLPELAKVRLVVSKGRPKR